jgi:hypothetical protein
MYLPLVLQALISIWASWAETSKFFAGFDGLEDQTSIVESWEETHTFQPPAGVDVRAEVKIGFVVGA